MQYTCALTHTRMEETQQYVSTNKSLDFTSLRNTHVNTLPFQQMVIINPGSDLSWKTSLRCLMVILRYSEDHYDSCQLSVYNFEVKRGIRFL